MKASSRPNALPRVGEGQRPAPWLQTLRIEMREFTRADFDDLLRLDGDPRVTKFVNHGKRSLPKDIDAQLARAAATYRTYYGLGAWYATRRDTGAFIGWFALKHCPPTCDVEIGYRLRHEAWGQGFATEGATELVRYGFDDLGLDRIIGVTERGNRASQRVLLKVGLRDAGYGNYYSRRLRLFVADRAARPDVGT